MQCCAQHRVADYSVLHLVQGRNSLLHTFADRLRGLMAERAVNQLKIEEVTGISQSTVSRYMRGETEPKITEFVAIARFFGMSLDDFIGTKSDPPALREQHSSETEVWRRRAKVAEQTVAELRNGMRDLLSRTSHAPKSSEYEQRGPATVKRQPGMEPPDE